MNLERTSDSTAISGPCERNIWYFVNKGHVLATDGAQNPNFCHLKLLKFYEQTFCER
jgi:hypothetical protein